jgi:putative methionine-R-sulfoxide reductase with GAF domain
MIDVLAAAQAHREALQPLAASAAALLGGRAASIGIVDDVGRDVVFAAVAGEGEDELVGARFPAGEGVAGAVIASGSALVVDDLAADTRFARDVATASGYVPDAITAIPLARDGRTVGVLSVLDPARADLPVLETLAGLIDVALDLP